MAYKLTDKAPTEPGYYWAKQDGENPTVVEVDRISYKGKTERMYVYAPGNDMELPLSKFILWSERIEVPEE
jgi:hypothetical protein